MRVLLNACSVSLVSGRVLLRAVLRECVRTRLGPSLIYTATMLLGSKYAANMTRESEVLLLLFLNQERAVSHYFSIAYGDGGFRH
jgi:hypothetical protein